MNKITIGRTRKKSKAGEFRESASRAADAVFVLGAAAVCVMLALPMTRGIESPEEPVRQAAVMVMSSAVQGQVQSPETGEREELARPSNTQIEEEWSCYDYIGELFAGLISGR